MKTYEDTKSEIIEFMGDTRFIEMFQGKAEHIKNIIADIFDDIELLMKNEDIESLKFKCDKIRIEDGVDTIMYVAVEFPISEIECDLLKNITQLFYNYNDNVIKDESIKIRSSFLTNFLDGFLSLRDAINIIRNYSRSSERLTKFNPPSFELSRHYIDSLYCKYEDSKQS